MGKIQWSKKGPHKKPKVSSLSMKRIGNIARGTHSISREQVSQIDVEQMAEAYMLKREHPKFKGN